MFQSLYHLVQQVYDVKAIVQWGGVALVCAIVFVETGLFVGFFLPGDSLLVTAGIFAAAGVLKIELLAPLVALCAVAGDQLGYWIGRQAGQALYRREDSLFFRRRHLAQAHEFYETHGGKAVILARFVPIARTFCPPVAGAARMSYRRYLAYDVVGGCCWAGGLTLAGYFLGSLVPNIGERIHWVIIAVVALSLLPPAIGWLRSRSNSGSAPKPKAREMPLGSPSED